MSRFENLRETPATQQRNAGHVKSGNYSKLSALLSNARPFIAAFGVCIFVINIV
jgi:hypothetical protein